MFITDDIIASGESMLEVAYELKKRSVKHIIACINREMSVSSIIDPISKIEALLERHSK